MKKAFLHLILIFICFPSFGQITLTTDYFPAAGDTLRVATAVDPNIDLLSPGGDVTWDFTSLVGPVFESVLLDPSEGIAFSSFSEATVLTGQVGVGEQYFKTTATTYESLGFSGADPIGIGLDVIFRNEPPLVERRAPLNYPDLNTSTSSVSVPFAWADLPSIVTDSLGTLPITPDSIGIEVITDRVENIDAWGTVQLPMGDYEVLRLRRRTITDTRLKAFVPIFGWTDVTDLVPNEFLGKDTTLSYRFYNNDIKEEIAIINVNPIDEEILNVRFKSDNSTTSLIKLHTGQPNIQAYPNPAIHSVRFDVVNMPAGKYHLKMFNILGTQVWDETYRLDNQRDTISIDLYTFKKGTYLYSLIDEYGTPIVTRRLMIIRP